MHESITVAKPATHHIFAIAITPSCLGCFWEVGSLTSTGWNILGIQLANWSTKLEIHSYILGQLHRYFSSGLSKTDQHKCTWFEYHKSLECKNSWSQHGGKGSWSQKKVEIQFFDISNMTSKHSPSIPFFIYFYFFSPSIIGTISMTKFLNGLSEYEIFVLF